MMEDPNPTISLLWPDGRAAEERSDRPRLNPGCAQDLGLAAVVRGLCVEPRYADTVERILLELPDDPRVIRYRQEVLEDLLDSPALLESLEQLLPRLSSLHRYRLSGAGGDLLHEVARRLGELSDFTGCIRVLADLPGRPGEGLRSEGWRRLRAAALTIREGESFGRLVRELPEMLVRVRGIGSITVGINLNPDLQPGEAVLLSVQAERFLGPRDSLLGRLLGVDSGDERRGIAPLHRALPPEHDGPRPARAPLTPLFRDLAEVTDRVCRPVAAALKRYLSINTRFLAALSEELAFYLGAVRLERRLRELGLPLCRPELASREERICRLESAWNLNLALRMAERNEDPGRTIVSNDVEMGRRGRIFILTGPNRGGKTTYVQAVGLTQLLAQAGLHVPARKACISPVDGIYTHFPEQEHPEMDAGRLGEEALRLSGIFTMATPHSLVLMNESLATTSPRESLELARDVLRALRVLGARAIYITHLHELAAEAGGEEGMASLVSRVQRDGRPETEGRPTFRIEPGPPAGSSHAAEIAGRYGISYDQLVELLRRRGVVD